MATSEDALGRANQELESTVEALATALKERAALEKQYGQHGKRLDELTADLEAAKMVVVARTDEVATLSRQLATVQQQAQEHERTRKHEVMRLSKEIEKLKGVIAEHPVVVEKVAKEKAKLAEEQRDDLQRQVDLLKGMVRRARAIGRQRQWTWRDSSTSLTGRSFSATAIVPHHRLSRLLAADEHQPPSRHLHLFDSDPLAREPWPSRT